MIIFILANLGGLEKIDFPMTVGTIAGIILIGANTFLTFYLTLYGYKFMNVNRASLILLLEVVFSFIIGWLVYQEVIDTNKLIGAAMVLTALALPLLWEMRKPAETLQK